MTISAGELHVPEAVGVSVGEDAFTVELSDGRTLTVPLAWYPRLLYATSAERAEWRFVGRGEGIHWPAVDEDISVEALIAGRPSAESDTSLREWLGRRPG